MPVAWATFAEVSAAVGFFGFTSVPRDECDERLDFSVLQIQIRHRVRRSTIGSIFTTNLCGCGRYARICQESPEVLHSESATRQVRTIKATVLHLRMKMAAIAAFQREQARAASCE